jgi:hypothetical protein
MAVIDIHGQKLTGKEAMNLHAVVKEAINLLLQPVHWTMEKADIVTAIANVAEKFAQETTNLRAQPVRRSAQNQEARPQIAGKNTDKSYLRGLAKRMADEGLAGQLKQKPRKTCPSRAQGQGAKRETCKHCGKSHAGECWYKPGVVVAKLSTPPAMRTPTRRLKSQSQMTRSTSYAHSPIRSNYRACSASRCWRNPPTWLFGSRLIRGDCQPFAFGNPGCTCPRPRRSSWRIRILKMPDSALTITQGKCVRQAVMCSL